MHAGSNTPVARGSKNLVPGVLLGALALCYAAFSNGFPFMYADTCTYLEAGFSNRVSEIRPATYGLLLRHLSMRESLWPVVIAQAVMVSWCVHTLVRTVLPACHSLLPAGMLLMLALLTRTGTVVGMLMPDVFTPVMLVCTSLLLTTDRLRSCARWAGLFLIGLSCAMHHSHTPILVLLLIAAALVRRFRPQLLPHMRRWRAVLFAIAVGHLSIPTIHALMDGGFRWSSATAIFLTNRLNQHGLLAPYLRRTCGEHAHVLCDLKDDLPGDLLWDPRSPIKGDGTWAHHEPAFRALVKDALMDPSMIIQLVARTAEGAVVQFFTFEGHFVTSVQGWTWSFEALRKHLPKCVTGCALSRQYRGEWNSGAEDVTQRYSVLLALSVVVFQLWKSKSSGGDPWAGIALLILLGLIANAFVCSGLSTVDARFQNRVVWLIPLLAFVPLLRQYAPRGFAGTEQ